MTETPDSTASQRLTLYLPGLLRPQDTSAAGSWRALETLLSRAEPAEGRPAPGYEESLFALFDLAAPENADLPVAAVTRMLDMGVIDNDWWLRADPVHLALDGDRLVLTDPRRLDITPEEAARLVAEIMEVFSADGWLLKAPCPERWYLKPARAPRLTTAALSRVAGRDVRDFLPRGADDKAWHTVLNEIQILLHGATVNVEREKAGKLPVNSLWFWGGGRLPRISSVKWAHVWSDEPVSLSLAKLSGTPAAALPASYHEWRRQAGDDGEHLVVLDAGLEATLYRDAAGWQKTLDRLEADWMRPLLNELKSGAPERVTLLTDSNAGFTLTPRQARRWWRRRRPLNTHRPEME